jgi:hypothetical protein
VSSDQLLKGSGNKRCEATHMGFFTRTPQRNSICDYYLPEHRNFQATVGMAIKVQDTYNRNVPYALLGLQAVLRAGKAFPLYPPCRPRVLHQRHAQYPVLARLLPDEVRTCAFYKTLGAHQNAGHAVSLAPRLRCLARQK